MLAQHKYAGLLFLAVFVAELALGAWSYTDWPAEILWLPVAGGLAGLIPSGLIAAALWRGHSYLREPGRPDRLAAVVRTVTIALWISCFSWIVPSAVGFLLSSRSSVALSLGLSCAIPIIMLATWIRVFRRQLTMARDAGSPPVLGSRTAF